jgi:imidazolonepropionase-like amidohydrolase
MSRPRTSNGRRRIATHAWPEPGRGALVVVALLFGLEAGAGESWVVEHACVIPSATAAPVEDGTVVVKDGRIAALGPSGTVRVPAGAHRVDGRGATVLPGFWNVHVHFTEERFADAAHRPADALSRACRDMLTSHGFTTVVDLSSFPANTVALRERAPSLDCPRILTTGISMFPAGAVPIYVRKALGDAVADGLAQPRTGAEAAGLVKEDVRLGARAVKLFVGTWLGRGKTGLMALEVVRGATTEAHRHGLVVFAHPQSAEGIANSIEGGVDVLAHTAPDVGPWTPELIARIRGKGMGLTPTLSLWRVEMDRAGVPDEVRERFIRAGAEQLRAFAAAGGEVLFGTDVGYIPEKDADEELGRMAGAGMDWRAILAALTSAPARRMKDPGRGELKIGAPGDLVLVEGDPRLEAQSLTRIRGTWVAGKPVFSR